MNSWLSTSWNSIFAGFWNQLRGKRAARRIEHQHRHTGFAKLESLEDRIVLSPFYDLSVVASTANGFVAFGDLVSINNAGTIAFVGYRNDYDALGNHGADDIRESGLWTATPGQGLLNVNPDFSNTNGRDFGRAVAINDTGILTARDRIFGDFFLREWNPSAPDFDTILASTDFQIPLSPYSAFQTFTDINNAGDVAFVAQSATGEFRTLELYQHGQEAGTFIRLDSIASGVLGGPTPRPQLTEDGRVLARQMDNSIVLFDAGGTQTTFASSADGFIETGAAPGITADGKVVVFTGNRGRGAGVFASYYTDGVRHIVRVAGEGHDGWTDFDLNSAIRVTGSIDSSQRGVTVAFEGTNSVVGHGIYTARVSFFSYAGKIYSSDEIVDVRVSGAAPVALVGGQVAGGGPTITELEPYGMNDQGRGELAFWVKTGAQEAIVRALPQQVVYVDMVPGLYGLGGYTAANLSLLQEVGVQNGWDGTFADAMTGLGYTGNTFNLAVQIRQKVQEIFNDTGARIRVVSSPPVAVMRTATDQFGNVLTINGAPIRNGTYQTVQVGQSLTNNDVLGLAAPIYTRAGELDFYNQVIDDTAVVFANPIFTGRGFDKPFAELTDAERIQAVAYIIVHEAGHNFGLVHTHRAFEDEVMHAQTQDDEFARSQDFADEQTAIDPGLGIPGGTENPTARLIYSTGGIAGRPGDEPTAAIVNKYGQYSVEQRYKLSGSLTSNQTTVARLLVGTVHALGADFLPEFQDLGTGTLANLMSGAAFQAATDGSVIIIGSTDGTRTDIIGVPVASAGAQDSLVFSAVGIASDTRLRGTIGSTFNLYRLPESGPAVLIGTFTAEGEPAASVLVGSNEISTGSVLGLGETTPGGGVLTKVISIRNTGAAPLVLGTVGISGPGYSISQPSQMTLASGDETTVTVTLSDATAGIGITGTLTIPSNESDSPFTLTLRGTVDNRPRVLGVTRIDNGTGPVRIAIDFSGPLLAGPAGNADYFAVARDNGESLAVVSAAYSQTGAASRVILTLSVAGNELPSGDYRVRFDGTQIVTATGAPLATTRENLLSQQVWDDATLVTIGADGNGAALVLAGPEASGVSPPSSIVVGDFNGDGVQDYIATSEHTGQLVFHWGVAEGGYETDVLNIGRPHPDVKAAPRKILTADWNNDGFVDLVVHDAATDYFQGNLNRLLVYLNDGAGTFVLAPEMPILLPGDAEGPMLAVGDFTGDGLPDVAIGGPRIGYTGQPYSAAGSVAIYAKDPFLGYSQVALLSTEHQEWFPYAASSADVNGDGRLDLVVATTGYFPFDPRPVVYLSTPTGLVLSEDLVYEGEGGQVTVGDFTGDGKADIAIVNDYFSNSGGVSEGGVVSLLVGNGAGQFTARPNVVLGRRGVEPVATGDVNQDGKLDLVLSATSYSPENAIQISVWVLHGDGSGEFDLTVPLLAIAPTGNTAPGNFVLQDITGDGYPELSFGNTITGQIGLFVNDGTGRLSPSRSGPLTTSATAFHTQATPEKGSIIVDINRDGFLDQLRIVSGYYQGGPVADAIDVLWGNAAGQFEIVASVNIPFLQPVSGLSFRDIGSLRVGDLNNDGWGDLVVSSDSGSVQIYLGVDGRDFVPAPEFFISASVGVEVVSGELVDVNADGNLDYLATVSGSSGVPTGFAVFFGNGTGKLTYNLTSFLPVAGLKSPFGGQIGQTPVIADLNGDQKLDLAIGVDPQNGQAGANRLLVYYGVGNGLFNLGQSLVRDPVDNGGQVHLHDVNGDGRPDLLSAGNSNDADDSITFYLGTIGGQFVAAPELTVLVGHQIGSLVFGDFTGDGHDDIALTRYTLLIGDFVTTVSIFAGDGSGAFAAPDLVDTGALWPHTLVVIPIAGTIEAGSFAIAQPVLSVPAGAANIATSTLFNKPVAIDPRPLFVPYTNDPIVLAVSIAPTHGTVSVQTHGTPGDLSDDTFVYTPATGYFGSDSFTYLAADGRGGTATGTVTIAVSPANQPPVVTPSAGSLIYSSLAVFRLIDPGILVADADSPNFQGGKLTLAITAGFDSSWDHLDFESTGTGPGQVAGAIGENVTYSGVVIGQMSGAYDDELVISFNSVATPAAVQAVLRQLTFINFESERPVFSQRTVTFTLKDGDGGTTNATRTILLPAEGSNLGPVITLSSGSPVYTAGTAAIVVDAAATITDADSANFAGGSLTIDFADFTEATDRLAIRSVGTGVGQINLNGNAVRYGATVIGTYSGGFVNNSALVITLGSAATPTTVQALLRQITFSNGDPTASALPRTIRFVADDGLDGIGEAAFRTVIIAELALVPVITLSSGPTEYPGDQTAIVIDDVASVVDEDSADFAGGSLTVSFASGQSTADRLGIFDNGTGFDEINLVGNSVHWGVTEIGTYSGGFSSNSALVITLNSNADPQTVGTLIRHITFNVESATPTTTDRIIHFVLNDGNGGTSQAAAKTIVVGSGASPAPTVQLSSGSPTFSKLGPAVAVDNQLMVTSPNLGGGVLTISINDVNTGKKKFDVFSTSSLSGIGTSRGTQLVAGSR